MRIPAEETDPDLVLLAAGEMIETLTKYGEDMKQEANRHISKNTNLKKEIAELKDDREKSCKKFFDLLASQIHENAVSKGFWDNPNIGEKLALIHAEVSELLEALRDQNETSKKIAGYWTYEEEAADILIRLFDFCNHTGIRLYDAMIEKMEYNKTRQHMHGKKF